MVALILRFFVLVVCLGSILECIYNFPVLILDISLICFTLFLYYSFRVLRLRSIKTYGLILTIGLVVSFLNFLPLGVEKSQEIKKFVNQRGILEVLLKGNVYKFVKKNYKVKSIREFVDLAKIYYIDFIMNFFYIVFLIAIILTEIIGLRSWLINRNLGLPELT